MIDGVHFADHLCVVALGIGIDGQQRIPCGGGAECDGEHHPGSGACWSGCGIVALDVHPPPILAVLGRRRSPLRGSAGGVGDGIPVIGRCSSCHKIRNVQ